MTADRGLSSRLYRDFLLQAAYITAAVVLGLFAVSFVVEDILIKQALEGEAEFYWEAVSERDLPLPQTRNMMSYRDGVNAVPDALLELNNGYHPIHEPSEALAYITGATGDRLYLVFDTGGVNYLVTWFGLVPLALVLVVIYLSLFQAYRVSRRAVSPIINLSRKVEQLDPANPDSSLFDDATMPADTSEEIHTLNSAMQKLTRRLVSFVDRETHFTRDASHELRSPLTVIRMATDKLKQNKEFDERTASLIDRIRQSAKDMEDLTEAFLLLARESNHALPTDWVVVNDLIDQEIERTRMLTRDKPVEVTRTFDGILLVHAPEKVIASTIGNLLRNAVNYTDEGKVSITIDNKSVIIEDTGSGMEKDELEQIFRPFNRGRRQRLRGGFGVGLTIVNRLCDRFDWPLNVDSTPGVGTKVTVSYPQAKYGEPLSTDARQASGLES